MKRIRSAVVSSRCSSKPGGGDPGTNWELTLECGHRIYRHRQSGWQNRNWKCYPAPKYVVCKKCGVADG